MQAFSINVDSWMTNFFHKMENEDRIVLSASFGEGKSYFLNRFQERFSNEYNFITIFPVNYTISSHEQILEYIKRDIIFQLSKIYDSEFKRVNWSAFFEELNEDALKSGSGVISSIAQLFNVSVNLKKSSQSSKKYIESFNSSGLIYESDDYSRFIVKAFEKIRETYHKKMVLIIEDLDRILPHQMFSILNVFGSHFDRPYLHSEDFNNNKFGFDKVVFVMDYNRAKDCFHHFYGDTSNFEGYIAKYLDGSPFYYSIKDEAAECLTQRLYPLYGFKSFNNRAAINLTKKLKGFSIRTLERLFLFDPQNAIKTDVVEDKLCVPERLKKIEAYKTNFGIDLISLQMEDQSPENEEVCALIIVSYCSISIQGHVSSTNCRYYIWGNKTFEVKQKRDVSDFTIGIVSDWGAEEGSVDLRNHTYRQCQDIVNGIRSSIRKYCY